MKPAEFRGQSDEHLALTLKETVKNLFHLRFQSATERLETPSEIRKAQARRRPHQDHPARTRVGRPEDRRGSEEQWLRQAAANHEASGALKLASSPAIR